MTAIIQRPLRGSRISTFYPVKNLPSLSSLDSAFQLQEYISLLIRLDVHDVNAIVSLPGNPSFSNAKEKDKEVVVMVHSEKKDVDVDKGKGEPTVDEACWIYEQLRRLAQDLSHPLITTLQQECTRASCPEMKAGEWLYLCVAHGNDGAMEHCCAIDYILHTVDSATALLNSPRTFPSRLQIPVASHRHFSSLARRLGRIFAHAYFHHREAFEQAEAESSLYARFLALTERFDLVPAEFLVIPTDGPVGEPLGLGHPPSRSPRDDRRANEFDRSYHQPQQQQQQHQQRTRYDLDLAKFHHGSEPSVQQRQLHSNVSERDSSPPSPESTSGSIGESPSLLARARFGRLRTGTMVFAEAEANAVTDELAARSTIRERQREPQKIELLERVAGDPVALRMAINPSTSLSSVHDEDEEMPFEINLSPEEAAIGEGGSGGVVEETSEPVEKHELPIPLDLDFKSKAAGNTLEVAVLPSAPGEPEATDSTESSSTVGVTPASTSGIVADQPKEEPEEPAASTEVKSDDGLKTQPIPTETTKTDIPPADDNVSIPIPEPPLIPEEAPEAVSNQEVETKSDDKDIPPSVINDDESRIVTVPVVVDETLISVVPEVGTKSEPEPEKIDEASLDEVPADKAQPEVVIVDAGKPVVEPSPDVGSEENEEVFGPS